MRAWASSWVVCAAACGGGGPDAQPQGGQPAPVFVDVALLAGIDAVVVKPGGLKGAEPQAGGVAAGDFDKDGCVDLFFVAGSDESCRLLRNRGDGTFEDVAAQAGVDLPAEGRAGPTFVDYDGDGCLDLFLGGVEGVAPVLFRNRGDGTFEDVTVAAGLVFTRANTWSTAWADIDGDGDLDLFACHWVLADESPAQEWLWRNDNGVFVDISEEAGIAATYQGAILDYGFTPNFADIDGDGDLDLLVAADFGTSQVFRNDGGSVFTNVTTPVISDENGMGAAVGDYDNDGDLDWFVSSIFDEDGFPEGNWGVTGNRLYRNRGDGTFDDVTGAAGVRHGWWGWGSCFADLDLDGWLDLFHVNGATILNDPTGYSTDPSRLFWSNRDGTFTEAAPASGIDDRGQGRGVCCLDFDRDGDLDLFVANIEQDARLYRNDAPPGNWLLVRLEAPAPNPFAVGARIRATAGGLAQLRELRAGNNYVSADPIEAHFGLGASDTVARLRVTWPDGAETDLLDVAANRVIVVRHPALP